MEEKEAKVNICRMTWTKIKPMITQMLTTKTFPQRQEMNINSKMEPSTKDNGAEQLDTAMESKFGLTVLVMRVSGKTTKHMERESSGMSTEMYSMVNGRMTRLTDTVFTLM